MWWTRGTRTGSWSSPGLPWRLPTLRPCRRRQTSTLRLSVKRQSPPSTPLGKWVTTSGGFYKIIFINLISLPAPSSWSFGVSLWKSWGRRRSWSRSGLYGITMQAPLRWEKLIIVRRYHFDKISSFLSSSSLPFRWPAKTTTSLPVCGTTAGSPGMIWRSGLIRSWCRPCRSSILRWKLSSSPSLICH